VKDNNAIITNAIIFDGYKLISEDSIHIQNGNIKAIGNNKDITKNSPSDIKTIDAAGKFLMPAFIDGHGHFASVGYAKMKLDLRFAKNWDEVVALVKEAVAISPKGYWIEGEGWHQEKWNKQTEMIEGFPTNQQLNQLSDEHPIALLHAARHSAVVNHIALQKVGFDSNSKIDGGKVVLDSHKNMTGALEENAINPIRSAIAKSYKNQHANRFKKAIQLATEACLQNGITSFHDAHTTIEDWYLLNEMENDNALNINLWLMMHETIERMNLLKGKSILSKHLKIGAIKRYMDGALGNRGAWFFEGYDDAKSTFGHCTLNLNEYEQICKYAAQHNLQMCTHAIGDKANHQVLKTYEKTINNYSLKDHRWRIEHAQHLKPTDINLFSVNKILASIQTNHCTSDAGYVEQRLGKKRTSSGAYKWQTLWQKGVAINNGTDCPIEPVNTIENFYAAVTRKNSDGIPFYENEKLSREQALQAYTINNAFAAKQEKKRGSIEVDKVADLCLLDNNLLTISEERIKETKVEWTMKEGSIEFYR